MNNERDSIDLEKAVKEYKMKKASEVISKSKPATRGRFMDMVKPSAQTRPAARNYSTGKTIPAPASTPMPKVEAKSGPMTATKRRMDMVMSVKKTAPAPKPVEEPKRPMNPQPKPTEEPKPQPKEDTPRPNLFSDDDFAKDEPTPNANNFSLGGRSPFIRDAKVDKRPLGPNVPESNAGAIRSTKNVYSQKTPLKAESGETPGRSVITVAAPKKKSGWLWALLTVGIIAAGGGIGLIAYMIFTSN